MPDTQPPPHRADKSKTQPHRPHHQTHRIAAELSRTWSGPSRGVVEGKQQNEAPVCEVECELVDEQGGYLSAHDDRYVAQSLMLKASSLLGTNLPLALRDKSRPLKRARPQGRTSESS